MLCQGLFGIGQTDSAAVRPLTPSGTQPTSPTQTEIKKQSDRQLNSERLSKEKGQTQKQTKVQPQGLPPNLTDTVQRARHARQKTK